MTISRTFNMNYWYRLLLALAMGMAQLGVASAGEARPGVTHSMLHTQGTQWVKADGSPIQLKGVNLGNWLLLEFWMMGYADGARINDQCTLQAVFDKRFGSRERERLMNVFRDNWMTSRDWDLIPQFGLNLVRIPFIWSLIEDENNPRHVRADAWHYLDLAI
jgi:glucan 1,3-beta-glucosidase